MTSTERRGPSLAKACAGRSHSPIAESPDDDAVSRGRVWYNLAVATDGYERWLLGLGKPFVRAYDKRNGELVGEIEVPAPVRGVPMTYLHEGRQYIAMPVAEPTNGRPRLIALALPR